MARVYLIINCLLLATGCAFSQPDLLKKLADSKHDTARVNLLIKLNLSYLSRPDNIKSNSDSALLFAKEAKQLSHSLKYKQGEEEADFGIGKSYAKGLNYDEIRNISKTVSDSTRIKIWNELVSYCLAGATLITPSMRMAVTQKKKLDQLTDTAIFYGQQILTQLEAAHITRLRANTIVCIAQAWHEKGDYEKCEIILRNALNSYRRTGTMEDKMHICYSLAFFTEQYKTVSTELKKFRDSVQANSRTAEEKKAFIDFETDRIKSWAHYAADKMDKPDELEHICMRMEDFFEGRPGTKYLWYYYSLSYQAFNKGDYATALIYALKMIKLDEARDLLLANGETKAFMYDLLGRIYYTMGNAEQSVFYFLKERDQFQKDRKKINPVYYKMVTRSYLALNKSKEALLLLNDARTENIADSLYGKKYIAESKGNCYFAIGDYEKAERYYLECLEYAKTLNYVELLIAYVPLGRLYVQTNHFDKARLYLDELLKKENKSWQPLFVQREVELLAFRSDSASGKYRDALTHLQRHKMLNDSMFSDTKNKQFEELKIRYETEKKDKNIELLTKQGQLQESRLKQERLLFEFEKEKKKHDFELLTSESDKKDKNLLLAALEADKKSKDIQFKEQNIQLLHKQGQLQKVSLQQTIFLRNVLIGGTVMLLILLGLIYNRYRSKQKTNRLLHAQQNTINQSNAELKLLNHEQQKLLTEKEWLIKEIHHRVKNNLQMVISLLNTQTEFLNNPTAINAIRESRERMQAIAIIHQKLYQAESSTQVNMRSYINELLYNIKNIFPDINRINFKVEVADIGLDISQSVPLGLILNEAITNAVKYAYTANENGPVWVSLKKNGKDQLQLKVADKGKGLPEGLDAAHSDTLGLQLIKLFSEQLDADLFFINNNGLEIMLNFKAVEYKKVMVDRITA